MHQILQKDLPKLLEQLFDISLPMITQDFSSFPEHRVNFFFFLKSVVRVSFHNLMNLPKEKLKTIIDCIIYAIKHDLNTIYDIGLETLLLVLNVKYLFKFYIESE